MATPYTTPKNNGGRGCRHIGQTAKTRPNFAERTALRITPPYTTINFNSVQNASTNPDTGGHDEDRHGGPDEGRPRETGYTCQPRLAPGLTKAHTHG